MQTEIHLSDDGLSATANCTTCGTAIVLFAYDVPKFVRTMLSTAGIDAGSAIGSAAAPENAASIYCKACSKPLKVVPPFSSGE